MVQAEEPQGCLSRLRSILPSLRDAERRAAEFILQHPQEIIHLPISELAERCGASEATIFRLCRRLGYSGYQAMKISLARDLVEPLALIHEEVTESDSPRNVAQKEIARASCRDRAGKTRGTTPAMH